MRYLLYSLRPKQWIKNLFILLPLIFGKKLFIFPSNLKTAIAVVLFSIAASAVYLVNDIIDIEKDKIHPTKRLRPIASGKMSLRQAWITAFVFACLSLVLSFILNKNFGFIIIGYLAFNVVYSIFLKDIVILDVFCIGGFFLLRIMAGSVAAEVAMSHWIIIMTVLLAMFLGFNKRRQELKILEEDAVNHRNVLTKYSPYFIDQMISVVTSSIVIAYMLYTVDGRTISEFGTKNLIFSIPFVYYGIFRYLYLVHKISREDDPTRMLLADKMTQLNILLWLAVCIAVIYFGF